ncbi:hypothetical protein ACTL32_10620 [Planococcus sp. FY231025]|uniref:hypothetical protein n=1 Tax=Planococcus sp. FY231025 TaxID=3455699 RepID=UPI003F90FE3E
MPLTEKREAFRKASFFHAQKLLANKRRESSGKNFIEVLAVSWINLYAIKRNDYYLQFYCATERSWVDG